MYWCCAQVEPRRERLASHCLGLAGYKIYQPLLCEQRRSRHGSRKIIVTPPLFPGYLFVWVVRGWWDARWSPGVVRLIMDGLLPARVPDVVRDQVSGTWWVCRAAESAWAQAGHAGEGSAGPAARSDWAARSLASARAGTRIAAAAGRATKGRACEECDRGG